jgi:hypothetical protein
VTLTYASGETVLKGGRVRYAGKTGAVEFVAQDDDPDTSWYVKQFGGGCMIAVEPFGRIFLESTADDEHLELLGRAEEKPAR